MAGPPPAPARPATPAAAPARTADLTELLTRSERLLAQRFTPLLEAAGVSVDGWRVLCLLADGHGYPMTEVATRLFLPPASLTKLMDHLVDSNLVYRRIDELDRRRIRAHLSPRGRRLHEQLDAQLSASLCALRLPRAEQELLASLLTQLTDALAES